MSSLSAHTSVFLLSFIVWILHTLSHDELQFGKHVGDMSTASTQCVAVITQHCPTVPLVCAAEAVIVYGVGTQALWRVYEQVATQPGRPAQPTKAC